MSMCEVWPFLGSKNTSSKVLPSMQVLSMEGRKEELMEIICKQQVRFVIKARRKARRAQRKRRLQGKRYTGSCIGRCTLCGERTLRRSDVPDICFDCLLVTKTCTPQPERECITRVCGMCGNQTIRRSGICLKCLKKYR